MHFAIFVVYLVANRACSLRLSFYCNINWIILYQILDFPIGLHLNPVGVHLILHLDSLGQQDLHGLQRFYHTVDHWGIKLYQHQFSYLVELLLVRYSNASLRLFCTRFTWFTEILSHLIFGVLSTITPIFIKGAIVSEIQKYLPEAICCCITRFTLFTEILSQC